ncbi:MAG: amidohydrolase family protein [Ignavibacteria bacterium]
MKIIDGHIHIGQWSDVFLNYNSTIEEAVTVMKESGVSSAIALTCDTFENEKLLKDILSVKDFVFHFAAWINPEDKTLDKFLEDNSKHIKCLKVHPSFQRKNVLDESFQKYFDYAEELKIPVIIHCGRWKEIASFDFPIALAKQRPGLNIILAHLGGDQPSLCTSCATSVKESGADNLYLGTESVREFYFVNEVVKTVGAEKVIFGSDYNLGLPKMYIPIVESLKISQEEKELIFSGNVSRLLNLE